MKLLCLFSLTSLLANPLNIIQIQNESIIENLYNFDLGLLLDSMAKQTLKLKKKLFLMRD